MKNLAVLPVIVVFGLLALGQEKPRVFVQGKGSEDLVSSGSAGGGRHWAAWGSHSTIDSHDEAMEVTKDLQKNCSQITVTLNQPNADYTVMLNRESKHNRGLLRTNSQLQVANRVGDVIGTNATRTVSNAAKDACTLIADDWQNHGRLHASASETSVTVAPAPTAKPTAPATAAEPESETPREQTKAHIVQSAQSSSSVEPQPVSSSSRVTGTTVSDTSDGLAQAARRAKQHKACLELAKDNPSITCK